MLWRECGAVQISGLIRGTLKSPLGTRGIAELINVENALQSFYRVLVLVHMNTLHKIWTANMACWLKISDVQNLSNALPSHLDASRK